MVACVSDHFRVSDEFWERIKLELPVYSTSPKGGRPRRNLRSVVDGIFYCLRTGCQWKAIPHSICPGSTCHDYFQDFVQRGVFARIWEWALLEYEELVGLDYHWLSLDGALVKAPLGGEKTGRNPTDRGKLGTKRSLLTDGSGIPVGLVIEGANRHDMKLLEDTLLQHIEIAPCRSRPRDTRHLCLDKGYDYKECLWVCWGHGYVPHIRSRGEEQQERVIHPGGKARRWVVERTHSWMNRFRRILIRWEKKAENYLNMLYLACAYITLQRAGVFG